MTRPLRAVRSELVPPAPDGSTPTDDDRTTIMVTPDEPAVINAAIRALARAPEVYARGSEIVEVITDTPSTRGVIRMGPLVRINRCPEARVRELLAREAVWLAAAGGGKYRAAHPRSGPCAP